MINLTHNMTFLGKSYIEWNKVEKPAFVTVKYVGPGDEEDETVAENSNNINNEYDDVSDNVDSNTEENYFDQDIKKVTPKTTLNPKTLRAIKF